MSASSEADARRRQLEAVAAFSGGDFDIEGHVPIPSTGESISEHAFNVTFREMPVFTFGFSLGDNETYDYGSIPTGSAVVLKWLFEVDRLTTSRLYTGALIGWVTTGRAAAAWQGHFRFSGRALVAIS